jgi:hypothetical protein
VVDRVGARFYASRARAEAVNRNRDSDVEWARWVLLATAKRNRSYAGTDRELMALAEER